MRPDAFTFLLTEVCGHPTVPCAPEVLDRLDIGPMPGPGDRHGTAFHVPVDLAQGTGTGVSAAERAATVRRLAHPGLSRPTSCGRATCTRCGPGRACWPSAPGTPRPRSRCAPRRACHRWACAARS